jgi:thymidine phosphorylase
MPEQMVASILSKKMAAGSTHLVLDIPVGPGSKVENSAQAMHLRKLFDYVSTRLELSLEVIMTDGSRPIGRGVGPWLEARDVLSVLRGAADAPTDLKEKSILLAGRILDFDPDVRGRGEMLARDLLSSGAAARKMDQIIEAQGPAHHPVKLGALGHEVVATTEGPVTAINCRRISDIARLAGAPTDPGAGIDLLVSVGDTVRRGEPLYRVHGVDQADFSFACDLADEESGYRIGVAG